MKRFSLRTWMVSLQQVALRFPFTLFFVISLASYLFLDINNKDIELQARMWAFFSVGIFLTLASTLFTENIKNKLLGVVLNLLFICLLLVFIFTLPDKFQLVHKFQLVALGLVFALSSFFVSYFRKNNDIPFWEFGKTTIIQLIISYIFSVVLMIGLSLAVLSLKELFKVDIQSRVYENLSVICFVIFAPIYFLTNVPTRENKFKQEYRFDNFLKILGLYILLPILLLYFLILYIYLIQIVVKWELPNGWVSTLVSTLALGGFVCMLILYPLRLTYDKRVEVFSRYFPLLILPLLVLMSIGIFRRIADYGLSINRCYVLILNVWLYGVSIYLFISKAKHLKWTLVSFAALAFLVSVGPWSVFSVTKRSIVPEMEQQLTTTGLWNKNKMINFNDLTNLPQKQREVFFDKFSYLFENYGAESVQYMFVDSLQKKNIWELRESIGLEEVYMRTDKNKHFNFRLPSNYLIGIDSNFKSVATLYLNDNEQKSFKNDDMSLALNKNILQVQLKGKNTTNLRIFLDPKIRQLIKSQKLGQYFSTNELTIEGSNYKLIITKISGVYTLQTDSIKIESMSANLFIK